MNGRKLKEVDLSKYTPEYQDVFRMSREINMSMERICSMAGVSYVRLNNWRKRYNPKTEAAGDLDKIKAWIQTERLRQLNEEMVATNERLLELQKLKKELP